MLRWFWVWLLCKTNKAEGQHVKKNKTLNTTQGNFVDVSCFKTTLNTLYVNTDLLICDTYFDISFVTLCSLKVQTVLCVLCTVYEMAMTKPKILRRIWASRRVESQLTAVMASFYQHLSHFTLNVKQALVVMAHAQMNYSHADTLFSTGWYTEKTLFFEDMEKIASSIRLPGRLCLRR